MRNKNWLGILFAFLLGACGGAEDSDFYVPSNEAELSDEAENFGDSDIGMLEQAFTIPGGGNYTFALSGQPHNRCTTAGVCLAPRDKTLRFKMGTNWTIGTLSLSNAFNTAATDFCNIVNARGWNCAITTGSSNETLNGVTGTGPINKFLANNINSTVFTDSSGRTWKQFNACNITINKTAIEADPNFPNLSPTTLALGVRTHLMHLFGHCAGLGNSSTNIMSASTMTPVTNTFTTQELSDLQAYQP